MGDQSLECFKGKWGHTITSASHVKVEHSVWHHSSMLTNTVDFRCPSSSVVSSMTSIILPSFYPGTTPTTIASISCFSFNMSITSLPSSQDQDTQEQGHVELELCRGFLRQLIPHPILATNFSESDAHGKILHTVRINYIHFKYKTISTIMVFGP